MTTMYIFRCQYFFSTRVVSSRLWCASIWIRQSTLALYYLFEYNFFFSSSFKVSNVSSRILSLMERVSSRSWYKYCPIASNYLECSFRKLSFSKVRETLSYIVHIWRDTFLSHHVYVLPIFQLHCSFRSKVLSHFAWIGWCADVFPQIY